MIHNPRRLTQGRKQDVQHRIQARQRNHADEKVDGRVENDLALCSLDLHSYHRLSFTYFRLNQLAKYTSTKLITALNMPTAVARL